MGIFFTEVTGGEHTLCRKSNYKTTLIKLLFVFVLKFLFTAVVFHQIIFLMIVLGGF